MSNPIGYVQRDGADPEIIDDTRDPWEGLGGPIRMSAPSVSVMAWEQKLRNEQVSTGSNDPTLHDCIQCELDAAKRGSIVQRTLARFDVVSARERQRRHLLRVMNDFHGCRCLYDPVKDGGEYRALMELRKQQHEQRINDETNRAADDDNFAEDHRIEDTARDNENDDEDDEYDYLLEDDPTQNSALQTLEEQRRAELELSLWQREVATYHGYGVHRQMHPDRVLLAAGLNGTNTMSSRTPPPAVILHLFESDSITSASLDLYLEQLAKSSATRGTMFLRSYGRPIVSNGHFENIVQRAFPKSFGLADLPALIAIREGVVQSICPGLLEFKSDLHQHYHVTDGINDEGQQILPSAVDRWLDRAGVLLDRLPVLDSMCHIRPEEEALMDYLVSSSLSSAAPTLPKFRQCHPIDNDERFDCGVEGCHKTFPHEHVGFQTTEQTGFIVTKEQVMGRAEP